MYCLEIEKVYGIMYSMKLESSFDKTVVLLALASFMLFFSIIYTLNSRTTYAEGENSAVAVNGEYYVNLYDDGEKLIVKTSAKTVGDALERAGIEIGENDKVEPALNEPINGDNFFVNIYRARPVIVRDSLVDKYILTASYDTKTIAKEAGLTVYDGDQIMAVRNQNFLEVGAVEIYEVTRGDGNTVTEETEIPFSEETVADYNLALGTQEVRQLGEVGLKVMSYEVFYENGVEVKRELKSEEVKREPVTRIVAVGASSINASPLTRSRGRNYYTGRSLGGALVERQETYYDLNMNGVMAIAARECGVENYYTVREDGVKVDADGYVLVAANLYNYPRCSVVETSLGLGRVYDTGGFAQTNPEQFDIATDWTNWNGQ